jgi:hypothetical protein
MYAERNGDLVVFAGHAQQKRWWNNLRGGAVVQLVLRGRKYEGQAEAILNDAVAIMTGWAAYAAKFPRSAAAGNPGDDAVFVRITLSKKSAA